MLSVLAVENGALKVQRANGSETLLPLGEGTACFDVGEKRNLKVAAGDKLLLQANAVAVRQHFVNGELVEVKTIIGDSILLVDGRVIPAGYRTFTHGYAITSHAAQGKTVDEVLVVASARSLPAVSREQFYVSISRGRERCRIFTDDSDLLRSHVAESSVRLAAVEAMPVLRQRGFLQTILQRGNRFLKRFRQRVAQAISVERSYNEIKPVEPQRRSYRIGV
jgi:ATP-dependent exoDNAse (exonuclease V) alpha subunit